MKSDLFHMGIFSPLVQILDSQKGYCLLKNLCSCTDRHYSVGVELNDGTPRMAIDDPNECWVKAEQADEVMRDILNSKSYNKATKDWYEKE